MYRGRLNPRMIRTEIDIQKYLIGYAKVRIEHSTNAKERYWFRRMIDYYKRDIKRLEKIIERSKYKRTL